VREGFAVAEGEILMILDADLTMPPEELPKFYEAIAWNRCEFANGSRLI
jgi:glycosyl transferase family 2